MSNNWKSFNFDYQPKVYQEQVPTFLTMFGFILKYLYNAEITLNDPQGPKIFLECFTTQQIRSFSVIIYWKLYDWNFQ